MPAAPNADLHPLVRLSMEEGNALADKAKAEDIGQIVCDFNNTSISAADRAALRAAYDIAMRISADRSSRMICISFWSLGVGTADRL